MNHRKIFRNVCNFIDGELDDDTCEQLQKHLEACPRCRIYVDTVRKTIQLYKETAAPASMPDGMRERLHATIALKFKPKK